MKNLLSIFTLTILVSACQQQGESMEQMAHNACVLRGYEVETMALYKCMQVEMAEEIKYQRRFEQQQRANAINTLAITNAINNLGY